MIAAGCRPGKTHKDRGVLPLYNDVYLPYHALKHVAIDLSSLLKQAAGLRPVCEAGACTYI